MTSPKPGHDKREVDFLLARGRLSGAERERILAAVLDATARQRPWYLRVLALWTISPWRWALAAAATVVFVAPMLWVATHTPLPVEMRAKGAAGNVPIIEAGCSDGCRRGSTLLFRAQAVAEPGYLSAFCVAAGGRRIWYFPSDHGDEPRLEPHAGATVLPVGARLGDEHEPGTCRLHLLLTRDKLSRDQALELAEKPFAPGTLVHTVVPLEIAP